MITTTWPELTLSAHPDTGTIRAGDIITGTVTITNTGKRVVHFEGGQPLPAQLLDLDGQVAGSYTGPVAGTGIPGQLQPGQSCQVRFLGDTAGTTTYLTPPGRYKLVVVVDLIDAKHPKHGGRLLTAPVSIDVKSV